MRSLGLRDRVILAFAIVFVAAVLVVSAWLSETRTWQSDGSAASAGESLSVMPLDEVCSILAVDAVGSASADAQGYLASGHDGLDATCVVKNGSEAWSVSFVCEDGEWRSKGVVELDGAVSSPSGAEAEQ
ncbi:MULTISPECIES: hypothetical protein [Bifidobacterium]|uniref:Uncharacterized protein n=2 Tax=Bifidobacterium TaxID=1678 RepID=A0A261FTG3_9BIFI|nr:MULTISPECIES: hypothetical protein [Bifidobacterium]OZG62484.1 hypothetical protein BLEM_1030 [Bifidobacterium lemurum]OZG69020.1 hypothetical protein BEUL_0426 [Bifidobacterium eulemuris]QOL31451.1 hypothetical protein BE0216_02500 [Bifidobacterium eulemuris]QOL33826.1 hypothetical protein BL8807_08580 [Bifidobacterium lemurum]